MQAIGHSQAINRPALDDEMHGGIVLRYVKYLHTKMCFK